MTASAPQLTVLGATGRVGAHVVRQALDRGLRVTALVRDPARVPDDAIRHPAFAVVRGTLGDRPATARALAGSTAVVSALGVRYRGGNPFRGLDGPADVVPTAVADVLAAADGAPRLVLLSALGAGDSWGTLPAAVRLVVRVSPLRRSFDGLTRAEALAASGHLPVTVVRAVTLTDDPGGAVLDTTGSGLRGNPKVSRVDVARLLVDEALRDGAADDRADPRPRVVVAAPAG